MFLFASCEIKSVEKNSTGKVLDVLVAADHGTLNPSTIDLIDSIFSQPQRCLPQMEPRFNMVKVPSKTLSNDKLFQAYRCIVKCDVDKNNTNKVFIDHDKWVKPQVYVLISASCEDSLQSLLRKFEPQIVNAFYDTEHQRFINLYSGGGGNSSIVSKIKEKYGFSMAVGSNFRLLKDKDDFVWIQEKLVEQGDKMVLSNLVIQTVPYESQAQLNRHRYSTAWTPCCAVTWKVPRLAVIWALSVTPPSARCCPRMSITPMRNTAFRRAVCGA